MIVSGVAGGKRAAATDRVVGARCIGGSTRFEVDCTGKVLSRTCAAAEPRAVCLKGVAADAPNSPLRMTQITLVFCPTSLVA